MRRLLLAAALLLGTTACSGESLVAEGADSGIRPNTDGFAFANFGASGSPEVF